VPSSTVRRQRQPTRTALGKQERLRVTAPGTRPSPLPRRQWPGIPARSLVIAQPIEQGLLLRLPTARAEPAPSRKPRSARRTTRRLPPSSARNANSIASDAQSSHFLAAVDRLFLGANVLFSAAARADRGLLRQWPPDEERHPVLEPRAATEPGHRSRVETGHWYGELCGAGNHET